jgi:hypothetical protein
MIKPTHQAAYNYAQAIIVQQAGEEALSRAVAALGSDNTVVDLCGPLRHGYRNLLIQTIGEHLYEWLEWWMWECDHGTKPLGFTINDVDYDPTTMTLYRFLEIVDAHA